MDISTILDQNVIYETLVSTYSENNIPNVSPMGIVLDSNKSIIIKPFNKSDTSKNLEENKACIVSFTLDPELFVNSTLFQEEFNSNLFVKSDQVNAPILLACQENYLALIVEKIETIGSNRKAFYCQIVYSNIDANCFIPYTRAFTSLIEILIHSTRLQVFYKNKSKNKLKLKDLKKHIEHHTEIIRRVANEESIYRKLLTKIQSKISTYMNNL